MLTKETMKKLSDKISKFKLEEINDFIFYSIFFSGIFPVMNTLIDGAVNIEILGVIYAFILIGLLGILGIKLYKKYTEKIDWKFLIKKHYYLFFIGVIFSVVLYSRLLTVINVYTPPLHDPVSHSIWAKDILIKNEVDFFYSPFIHSMAATLNTLGLASIPRLILLITNLGYVLLPITTALTMKYKTRNTSLAIGAFLVLSSIFFPANFYYRAGKNAFTFGVLIAIFTTYFAAKFAKKRNFYNGFSLLFALLTLYLTHYPMAAITGFFLVPFLGYSLLDRKHNIREKVKMIFPYIASMCLAVAWFLFAQSFKTDLVGEGNDSLEESVTIDYSAGLVRRIIDTKDFVLMHLEKNFSIYDPFYLFPILLLLSGKKHKTSYQLSVLWMIGFGFILIGIIAFFKLGLLVMVMKTTQLIAPFLVAISAALIFFKSVDIFSWRIKNLIFWVLATLIIVYINIQLAGNMTSINDNFQLVKEDDMAAFEFINNDLDNQYTFLNSAYKAPNREAVIFPSDAGMWLPVYTDFDVVFSFTDFFTEETHENQQKLLDIIEDKKDKEGIGYFKTEYNVKYIYMDYSPFGLTLKEEHLDDIPYKTVFEQGEVKILELL